MLNNIAHPCANWIVLTTHPNREEFAIENLMRQAYETYCPMILKRIKHARRAYEAKRPLFPGYIFAKHPAQRHLWRPMLGTFGVRGIVRNGETPAVLPAGFVENLKAREIDGAIDRLETPFKPGQAVIVSSGAFDGFIGQVLEIRESDRVLLLLNMLNQQTRVNVSADILRSA